MVTAKLNLSMTEPSVRQIYAKQGDTGRVLDISLDQTPEDGTLRILRPDGVEVTSEAVTGGEVESGSSFESLTEADVTELTAEIEPVQDLNGYDKPWVGGAGKNKLQVTATSQTVSGVTFTVNSDGTIKANGTATARIALALATNAQETPILNESVIMNGCPSGGSTNTYFIQWYGYDGASAVVNDTGSGTNAFTPTSTAGVIAIVIQSGVAVNNLVFKPMIRLATETDTTWQPYSNICPIYGGNETNLLDTSVMEKGFRSTTVGDNFDSILSASGTRYIHSGAFNATQGLTFQITSHDLDYLNWYSVNMYNNGKVVARQAITLSSADTLYTYTVPKNTYEVVAINLGGPSVTNTVDPTKGEIQLNLGASMLPYVPYQAVRVTDVGKNRALFANESNQDRSFFTYESETANKIVATSTSTSKFVGRYEAFLVKGVSYKALFTNKGASVAPYIYRDRLWGSLVKIGSSGEVFTVDTTQTYVIGIYAPARSTYDVEDFMVIEASETDTAYEPYQGSTYTTSLGQTVYGGTLDMVSGVLTVDKAMVDLGSLTWVYDSSNNRFSSRGIANLIRDDGSRTTAMLCSAFRVLQNGEAFDINLDGVIYKGGADNTLLVQDHRYTVASEFKTAMNGVTCVYPLATPLTYQLTPQQIKTLVGTNNVWASSGDIVSIKFTYGGLLSELPSDATEIVGKCYCDVEQNGVSSMPFTLNVKKNERAT